MGKASGRKRGKRAQRSGETQQIDQRPSLQAFLICERVDISQDGVHSLYRVVDQFNLQLEARGPVEPPSDLTVNVPVNYVLFTRYGAGVGRFRASARLEDPDGRVVVQTDEHMFWLPSRERAHTMIGHITMPVAKSGPYRWIAVLDGEQIGEYVFTVELQRRFVQTQG